MANKPRSDSTLDSLNPKQKQLLREWLVEENLSYEKARERLRLDFSVHTSLGALSRFYASQCFSLRSSEASEFAENVVKELLTSGEKFDEATRALVRQKAFERAYARNGNLDELAVLAKILGDSRKLQLKERELEISREALELKVKQYADKISAARASLEKAKGKGGLDPSTLQLIEEQLKLL